MIYFHISIFKNKSAKKSHFFKKALDRCVIITYNIVKVINNHIKEMNQVNNFQRIRTSTPFTQETLAECLNIDRSTVAKWETGKSYPKAKLLPKIAEVLNCTVDELLLDESRKEVTKWKRN